MSGPPTRAAPAAVAGETDSPPCPPRHADSPASRFDEPRAPAVPDHLRQKSSRATTISDVRSPWQGSEFPPPLRLERFPFPALSLERLYAILRLRAEVFVVEQQSIYLDPDGLDPVCEHLLLWEDDRLIGYLRLLPVGGAHEALPDRALPPDVGQDRPHADDVGFGRLVVAGEARGRGLARSLVKLGLARLEESFPGRAVTIAAQQYLCAFYQGFGFVPMTDPYLLDGLLHLDMRRRP